MKLKPKHLLIGILCAAIVIVAVAFAWNELQKQPLDITFYGAEITADGTIIKETEFSITGYLKENKDELRPYNIYHDPITFKDIPEVVISLENYQGEDLRLNKVGDMDDPNYAFISFSYDPIHNWIDFPTVYLCGDMCCCIIEVHDGRYFVGSVDPDYDVESILAQFPHVTLEE